MDLGLTIEEFEEMEYVKFIEYAEIKNRKAIHELKLHRNLLGAILRQNPKHIMPLEGDWDDLEVSTPERVDEVLHKFNVHGKWHKFWNDNKN